jgi:hypothetical protein
MKNKLTIALALALAYLLTSYAFALPLLKPWEPSHPHDLFPGWYGYLFLGWASPLMVLMLARAKPMPWLFVALGFVLIVAAVAGFLLRQVRIRRERRR